MITKVRGRSEEFEPEEYCGLDECLRCGGLGVDEYDQTCPCMEGQDEH